MMESWVPRRSSLVDQTVRSIERGIRSGQWRQALPGERRLSGELQISRGTLRAALAQLARRNAIRITHGKACLILSAVRLRVPEPRSVGLVCPEPLWRLRAFATLWIDHLRVRLADRGETLAVHHDPRCYQPRPDRALDRLVGSHPHACWILLHSTEAMQRWFVRRGRPALVAGSAHSGVSLSAIDYDQRAICRHAVGTMLARGHRRLALLAPHPLHAGVIESEAGFRAGVAAARHGGTAATVAYHGPAAADVCRTVDRLFAATGRPTALLVLRSHALLTAWTHLAGRGVVIPRDLSLLALETEPFFADLVPELSCYTWDARKFADRLAQMVRHVRRSSDRAPRSELLMPAFSSGRTLGALR